MNLLSSFKTATVPAVLLGLFLTACQDARPPAAPAAAARPSPSSALGEVPGSDTDAPPADTPCVVETVCFNGSVHTLPAPAGEPCALEGHAGVCDGAGACLTNHVAEGTACGDANDAVVTQSPTCKDAAADLRSGADGAYSS